MTFRRRSGRFWARTRSCGVLIVLGILFRPDTNVKSADESRFVLPAGFVIEAVATPPLVRYPLFGCFDDEGRLYVAEGTGHSVPGTELVKLKQGKIVRLEDTNGDGKFDASTIFADGFVSPQGVLWHDGVVYVASHPAIWRLEDTDGDGRADKREEFIARFNFNGNGCDIHGPFMGPDGRLYWTDGRHGYRIERPDGTVLEGLASRIWRCRTDGNELERVAGGGFDNPVEVAWTPDGEMIGTMDQGAGDCLLHYVEGGVYPEDHPSVSEFVRTGPMLGVAKRYSVELPAALCGTMRYRSGRFGAEFRDALITTHYMTHKLVYSRLIREGATFVAQDTDFLVSTDTHLRLTDVLEDADGSLLTIDMGAWYTYGFLGNVIPRPEMLGAIYRIRRVDAPAPADPRGEALRIADRSADELVRWLDDPRPAVRDRVVERLAKLGKASIPPLEAVLRSGARSAEAQSNAVWALCRIDGPEARAATRSALTPESSAASASGEDTLAVVMNATHAVGLHRDPEAVPALMNLLKSRHLPLRRKAAEALGRIGKSSAVAALIDALRQPVDAFLEHSLIFALIQIDDREALQPALRDSRPLIQKAALIALDQMRHGGLTREQVAPLIESSDPALQQTALAVIARRPDWVDSARSLVRGWLKEPELTPQQQTILADYIAAASADSTIESLSGTALGDSRTPRATKRLLLGVVQQLRAKSLPAPWREGLLQVFKSREPELCWEALRAARTRGWHELDAAISELSRDPRVSPKLRVAALESLARLNRPFDESDFGFLIGQWAESTPPLERLAATRTLAAGNLTNAQLLHVADRCRDVSTIVLRLILPVFTGTNDPAVGRALVDALEKSAGAEALTTAELDKVLREYPAEVRTAAAAFRSRLAERHRDQAAYLARLTDDLKALQGSADAGKEVFLAPKHNCFACHRAVGRGGTIGPDLSRIGQFRTRAELLESIVFPSFSVTPQFQTHSLATRDGRVFSGIIVRETADAVFLRSTDLAEVHIARSDIDALAPSTASIMPDGLEKTLTRQQLADLLEFLSQQR